MSSEYFFVTHLHQIQHICFILAQLNNSALLLMIYWKAGVKFGSYRYIMSIFSMYSLLYSWVEMSTLPMMHVKVPAFTIIIDSFLKSYTSIGPFICVLYCGSFGLCIALLTAQFVYRFLVVCKPEYSRLIAGYKCLNVIWPCLIVFVLWSLLAYFGIEKSTETLGFLKEDLLAAYSIDIDSTAFVAIAYWLPDGNGVKENEKKNSWNTKALVTIFGLDAIIFSCILIILYCGFSIYWDIQSQARLMSERKIDLQKQLFFTLIFQTLLPFVLMYMTVGFIITSPLLSLEIGKFANLAGVTVAFYPALEPCVAMICIRDFREVLMFWKKPRVIPHWTSTT